MKTYIQSKLNRIKRGVKRAVYDIEKINTILDAGYMGYIGYLYEDTPITIPMAYGRIDNKIYLHGSSGNRMLLSLIKNGKASMTVAHLDGLVLARSGFHHSVNYRSASIFGNVSKIENSTEKEKALKCIMEQMIPGRWDSLRKMKAQELNQTLVIEILIETASAKVRNGGVLDEVEDESLPIWAGVIPIVQKALKPISDEKLTPDINIPEHITHYYEKHK